LVADVRSRTWYSYRCLAATSRTISGWQSRQFIACSANWSKRRFFASCPRDCSWWVRRNGHCCSTLEKVVLVVSAASSLPRTRESMPITHRSRYSAGAIHPRCPRSRHGTSLRLSWQLVIVSHTYPRWLPPLWPYQLNNRRNHITF